MGILQRIKRRLMCEPCDPLDALHRLAHDVLMLDDACKHGSTEKILLKHATRNISNEIEEMVRRARAERDRK